MRQDIYLYNDAGSWSAIAGNAVARIVEDYRKDDLQFVIANEVAPFFIGNGTRSTRYRWMV